MIKENRVNQVKQNIQKKIKDSLILSADYVVQRYKTDLTPKNSGKLANSTNRTQPSNDNKIQIYQTQDYAMLVQARTSYFRRGLDVVKSTVIEIFKNIKI